RYRCWVGGKGKHPPRGGVSGALQLLLSAWSLTGLRSPVSTGGGKAGRRSARRNRELHILAEELARSVPSRSYAPDQRPCVHHRWHHAERLHWHSEHRIAGNLAAARSSGRSRE